MSYLDDVSKYKESCRWRLNNNEMILLMCGIARGNIVVGFVKIWEV